MSRRRHEGRHGKGGAGSQNSADIVRIGDLIEQDDDTPARNAVESRLG
jgi:hypothetical protein